MFPSTHLERCLGLLAAGLLLVASPLTSSHAVAAGQPMFVTLVGDDGGSVRGGLFQDGAQTGMTAMMGDMNLRIGSIVGPTDPLDVQLLVLTPVVGAFPSQFEDNIARFEFAFGIEFDAATKAADLLSGLKITMQIISRQLRDENFNIGQNLFSTSLLFIADNGDGTFRSVSSLDAADTFILKGAVGSNVGGSVEVLRIQMIGDIQWNTD